MGETARVGPLTSGGTVKIILAIIVVLVALWALRHFVLARR